MATLTATGINCSNGTLDGFYTGATSGNTSYPIGSYLGKVVNGDQCSYNGINPNATPPGSGLRWSSNSLLFGVASGSAIAGTWRGRAGYDSTVCYLIQRVA